MRVQLIFWKRIWPLFYVRKWSDTFHKNIGLKFSIVIGPVEFRFWGSKVPLEEKNANR